MYLVPEMRLQYYSRRVTSPLRGVQRGKRIGVSGWEGRGGVLSGSPPRLRLQAVCSAPVHYIPLQQYSYKAKKLLKGKQKNKSSICLKKNMKYIKKNVVNVKMKCKYKNTAQI